MVTPAIIRFEPHGPAETGLEEWYPIDPTGLESGEPIQRVHIYHQLDAPGYLTGVWDCTAMTQKFQPYAEHEFMLVLEGAITMVAADGSEVTKNAGEAFFLPKGLPSQWKQEGYVRKYFVIFEDPGGQSPKNPEALSVISLEASGPPGGLPEAEIADPSIFIGDVPTQHNHVYFQDPTGQMTVGIWSSTAFETAATPFPRNELMHLLEGSVTLTDGDGAEHHFKAGDTAYVPKGAVRGWKSTKDVRKFYVIFEPVE